MGCNCGNKGTKSTVPVETVSVAQPVVQVAQGKPACNRCGCNPCACKEDHTVKLIESSYTTTVCTCSSWVMPAVGESVQLHLNQVTDLLPGAILYNSSVGHLHVQSYDRTTGYVLAVNQGGDDNAEGGTTFPEGMCFHVGIPVECDCAADWTGPCLAADFTSPAIGDTAQAAVTTVSGLFVFDTIDIGGYMYKIVEITDANSITVKNEGFGAPVGTVIKADPKCSGRPCQVKITVINNDNPCMQEPVKEGLVLVCDEGTPKPITGEATGQVLGWDNEDGVWKLVNAGITDKCTFTTKCSVTLDPQVTTYLIYLSNPGIFEVGDTFTLDGTVYNVAEVHTGVGEDANYIRANRSAPTAIGSIPKGTTLCNDEGEGCDLENWCEQIATNRDNINIIMGDTWRPKALQRVSIPFIEAPIITSYNSSTGELLATTNAPSTVSKDFSHTFQLTVPTPNTGQSSWTLYGNAYIGYRGTAYCDGHYHHETNVVNLPYTYFVSSIPPITNLLGNVTINGNKIIVDSNNQPVDIHDRTGWHYSARIDRLSSINANTINNLVNQNNRCYGPAAQNITIPFAVTVPYTSNATFDITINAVVNVENSISAAKATNYYNMDSPGINDDVKLVLAETTIYLSGLWVIS